MEQHQNNNYDNLTTFYQQAPDLLQYYAVSAWPSEGSASGLTT
jgi:hypothetical protein